MAAGIEFAEGFGAPDYWFTTGTKLGFHVISFRPADEGGPEEGPYIELEDGFEFSREELVDIRSAIDLALAKYDELSKQYKEG